MCQWHLVSSLEIGPKLNLIFVRVWFLESFPCYLDIEKKATNITKFPFSYHLPVKLIFNENNNKQSQCCHFRTLFSTFGFKPHFHVSSGLLHFLLLFQCFTASTISQCKKCVIRLFLYGLCVCTGDNPRAMARGLSSLTDAQTLQ